LDLGVLDEECLVGLPLTLVSGHIHALKITVPWTKVTSEPIQLHVNTIGEVK
jgi:vacuolar protein sorting-associated protein 13B